MNALEYPQPGLTSETGSRVNAAALFDEHRSFLWGLGYRLTGNAADADDIVQETLVRAISRPPADRERPWRPWLVQVALNLGRDLPAAGAAPNTPALGFRHR